MSQQPFVEPIPNVEPIEMLSPQQRTQMLAEILATIALRVVKRQESPEQQRLSIE
jgi:hypothetical protein